ncbi:uncharacterized protein EV420DRAFT_1074895 [Desarmillaria tabescens]|uniref:MYND-type domain-containing protein n=1 Tax=Armillaria tabescens TaxID=1929756 RepID=A0AA39JHV4_ARMTA|nr:uncharacterized protein EV420DRAFT_1074895 [Desarmillaria tabescens]KAK0442724.1 hypothetical protein EV420DRAFT_1074895 [Desarmillaria tabescens]
MLYTVKRRMEMRDNMTYILRCNNPECSVTGLDALKRCTACMNMTVCSTSCQKREWNNGHKQRCRYLRASLPTTMREEDEYFLNCVIKAEFPREHLMDPAVVARMTKGNEQYHEPMVMCIDYRCIPCVCVFVPVSLCPNVGQDLIDKRDLNKDTSFILQTTLPLARGGLTVTQVVENFDLSTIRVV